MLFLIIQEHTPENCPKDVGGSKALYNENTSGVNLKAAYGDYAHHTLYYIVEADDLTAINHFLGPGWMRCTAKIFPVSPEPIYSK